MWDLINRRVEQRDFSSFLRDFLLEEGIGRKRSATTFSLHFVILLYHCLFSGSGNDNVGYPRQDALSLFFLEKELCEEQRKIRAGLCERLKVFLCYTILIVLAIPINLALFKIKIEVQGDQFFPTIFLLKWLHVSKFREVQCKSLELIEMVFPDLSL